MSELNDYQRAAATYDAARGLTLDGLAGWREAVRPYVEAMPAGLPILDLGSGTGQFAEAFAAWFDRPIVGVEPADAMREKALAKRSTKRIAYLAGSSDQIPLADGSCGLAWLSTVIHHFPDLPRAAKELYRVLAPGSAVLIRSAFPGRHKRIRLFDFFPEGTRVLDAFPTVDHVRQVFEARGFSYVGTTPVGQVSVRSLEEFRARVAHRDTDTILRGLTDEEHAAGLARLDAAIAAGEHGEQEDYLDLLVFRRIDTPG